jgi:hypothetical protein
MRLLVPLHLLLNVHRQCECEGRTVARLRLHPDSASVHFDNALAEPKAGAALLARDRVVGLLELLKQLGLIGCLRTRRAAGVVLQYSSDRHASYGRPRSGEVRKNGFPQRWAFIKIKSFRYSSI